MNKISIRSHPKINLTLDILGKRADGYHEVKMIMQSLGIFDELVLEKTNGDIRVSTNLSYLPCDRRNIAYKAAELFYNEYGINDEGISISIKKYIPVAAGLAGGSSNAAAVLKGMCRLYNIDADTYELMKLGEKLGADVPYCLKGGTALAEGLGEIVTPIKGCRMNICLVKPGFSVSTADVFNAFKCDMVARRPDTEAVMDAISAGDISFVAKNICNVLENVTVSMHPVLAELKSNMIKYGALGAAMTGSGPTIFGVFDSMQEAQYAQNRFRSRGMFSVATKTM